MFKNVKRNWLGYVAVAICCTMIGSAVTLAADPTAQAEATVVVHTSPFTAAVQEVRDSVVGVNNYQIVRYSNHSNDFDSFFGDYFGFPFSGGYNGGGNRNTPVTEEEVLAGSGSGVVVYAGGYVLTNHHVVEDATRVTVTVNGEEFDATVVAYDENLDVAIVHASELALDPVRLGDSDSLMVGDWAICIGNPLSEKFTGTVTAGIVSGLNRAVSSTTYDKYGRKETITNSMIQVDAAINSGNSGGGMFNTQGELMGIPTMKYTGNAYSGASIESIGMCIPINAAKPLIEAVLNGEIQAPATQEQPSAEESVDNTLLGRPRMGITVAGMNPSSYALASGALPNGAYVTGVEAGSPAERAGIQVGDIIVDVNDTVITATSQVTGIIQDSQVGDVLRVKVYRVPGLADLTNYDDIPDGEYIDLEVTLAVIDEVTQ